MAKDITHDKTAMDENAIKKLARRINASAPMCAIKWAATIKTTTGKACLKIELNLKHAEVTVTKD